MQSFLCGMNAILFHSYEKARVDLREVNGCQIQGFMFCCSALIGLGMYGIYSRIQDGNGCYGRMKLHMMIAKKRLY